MTVRTKRWIIALLAVVLILGLTIPYLLTHTGSNGGGITTTTTHR